MNVTYTGKLDELLPIQRAKLEAKFAKIGKLLGRNGGSQEAHVILQRERQLRQAEITVRYHDKSLVGSSEHSDLFPALNDAIEKLEKQIVRIRTKWRDTKRGPGPAKTVRAVAEAPVPAEEPSEKSRRIHRVTAASRRKPMTLEEAILEIEGGRDYVVYRDTVTERLRVLLRRKDGNLDLVEA